MDNRKERGLNIANSSTITHKDGYYLVPSQSASKTYMVRLGKSPYCNCPDFAKRGEEIEKCKHIFAVEIYITKHKDMQGNTVITQTTRITYSQDWRAYDKSQTTEKEMFMELLHDLCESIEEPLHEGAGRPSLPLRDMIFTSALKVYTTFSLRRFISDIRTAQEKGYTMWTPHYSRVARYMENPKLTPIIKQLIKISSLPLKSVETDFAIDSSGFSVNRYGRWFNFRYRKDGGYREWIKAHIMVGVKTGIITGVDITKGVTADNPLLPQLVNQTAQNFTIREVSADKGYSSKENLSTIKEVGGIPYIPFKSNTTGKADGSMFWSKMFHYFMYKRDEFLQHYHQRSNVETVFHMVKSKFGSAIRNRKQTAQENELLLKVLCHNICVVIQEMNELGIEAKF